MKRTPPPFVFIADPAGAFTPIFVPACDAPSPEPAKLTLTVDVLQLWPEIGWTLPRYVTGEASVGADHRLTPAGTTIIAFAHQAEALIAANAATPA